MFIPPQPPQSEEFPYLLQMGASGQTHQPDILGIWSSQQTLPPAGSAQITIWQADLPGHNGSARQILQANQSLLLSANQALPVAEQRLAAENILPASLRVDSQPGGQAFSSPWDMFGDLQASAAEAIRFFDAMRMALAPQARVETVLGGQTIGCSELSWNGSVRNAFIPRLNPQQAARHRQVVAQVMLSRQSVMRMGVLIAASAATLASSALTGPLSLVFVYQFVRDLIAEAQKLGAAIQSPTTL